MLTFNEADVKVSLSCVLVFLTLMISGEAIGSSVEFQPDQLCNQDFILQSENLRSVHEIDVNLDSISELLFLIQYNNNARFHLFYEADCGFEEVTDNRGEPVSFLSYSSSSVCQPIGCQEVTFCADYDGLRHLVNVSGRHTLTPEQRHSWQAGNLPEKDITSQITISRYRLIDGKLIEMDSQVVQGVLKNRDLFKPGAHGQKGNGDSDGDSEGFVISTCQ